MSHEWAVFNDEGQLHAFVSQARAQAAFDEMQADPETHDAHAYVGPICPDHPEECAWNCQICNAEEDDENTEQCGQCGAVILGAHACQGVPGGFPDDEED